MASLKYKLLLKAHVLLSQVFPLLCEKRQKQNSRFWPGAILFTEMSPIPGTMQDTKCHEKVSNQRETEWMEATTPPTLGLLWSAECSGCVHLVITLPLLLPSLPREARPHSPPLYQKAKSAAPHAAQDTDQHSGFWVPYIRGLCSGFGQTYLSRAGQRKGPQSHQCRHHSSSHPISTTSAPFQAPLPPAIPQLSYSLAFFLRQASSAPFLNTFRDVPRRSTSMVSVSPSRSQMGSRGGPQPRCCALWTWSLSSMQALPPP